MPSIEDEIRVLIAERLTLPTPLENIDDHASLFGTESDAGDVGLDSLSSLELAAAISDRYEMLLDDIEPADFVSIATLADYLRRHGVSNGVDR